MASQMSSSFDKFMDLAKEKYNLTDNLGFDAHFLIDKLVLWGNKKFKVAGEKYSLLLKIENLSLDLISSKKKILIRRND